MLSRGQIQIIALCVFIAILSYGMTVIVAAGVAIGQQNEEMYAATGNNGSCVIVFNTPCTYSNIPYTNCYYVGYYPVNHSSNINTQIISYGIEDFEPQDYTVNATVLCYSYNFVSDAFVVVWKRDLYNIGSINFLISGIVCLSLNVITTCVCIVYIFVMHKTKHTRHVIL